MLNSSMAGIGLTIWRFRCNSDVEVHNILLFVVLLDFGGGGGGGGTLKRFPGSSIGICDVDGGQNTFLYTLGGDCIFGCLQGGLCRIFSGHKVSLESCLRKQHCAS